MNRKQRRATMKLGSPASANSSDSGEQIRHLFFEAVSHERARKFDDAVRAYKRVLAIDADHAEACNNLGRVLQAQGKTKDASAYYARSLALMPQLAGTIRGYLCNAIFIAARAGGSAPPSGRRMAAALVFERAVR